MFGFLVSQSHAAPKFVCFTAIGHFPQSISEDHHLGVTLWWYVNRAYGIHFVYLQITYFTERKIFTDEQAHSFFVAQIAALKYFDVGVLACLVESVLGTIKF